MRQSIFITALIASAANALPYSTPTNGTNIARSPPRPGHGHHENPWINHTHVEDRDVHHPITTGTVSARSTHNQTARSASWSHHNETEIPPHYNHPIRSKRSASLLDAIGQVTDELNEVETQTDKRAPSPPGHGSPPHGNPIHPGPPGGPPPPPPVPTSTPTPTPGAYEKRGWFGHDGPKPPVGTPPVHTPPPVPTQTPGSQNFVRQILHDIGMM